jgi:HlyD family secretion protein
MSLSLEDPLAGADRRILPLDPRMKTDLALGFGVAAAFFIGFTGWAAVVRLDAAATFAGAVTVAGHRQTVQSRDAGVIAALAVHDGDHVKAGQVLLSLAAADARANERSLASRVIHRQAEIARLRAEQRGSTVLIAPPEFAAYSGDDLLDAQETLRTEQAELAAQTSANVTRRAVLRARITETSQELDGYKRQAQANLQQQSLNGQELTGLKDLAAHGYAPQTRVRDLERTAAQLVGDGGVQQAEMAKLQTAMGETRLQIAQGDSQRAQEVAQDLRASEADLEILTPQWRAAKEQLARVEMRAPADGVVVGLGVNTIGGVVAPGQRLLDIVPDHAGLVIEAQADPKDAASLKIGQVSEVRFSSVSGRVAPKVAGRITRISADSFLNEKSGRSFYVIQVSVDPKDLRALEAASPGVSEMRPGQPAQVMIPLRKRTLLQYLLEPLGQTLWRSMRQL